MRALVNGARFLPGWGNVVAPTSRSNLIIGLVSLVFAAVTVFIWIPLDTSSGLIEKVRGRYAVGDALAPTLAALFIGLGGAVLILFERKSPNQPRLRTANLRFIGGLLAVLIAGFMVMLHAGPLALGLFDAEAEYRLLRDTAPWKYIGFFLGGIVIVAGLVVQAEGRMTWKTLWIAIAVTLALIFIYDVPFDDLLLPPNGDV